MFHITHVSYNFISNFFSWNVLMLVTFHFILVDIQSLTHNRGDLNVVHLGISSSFWAAWVMLRWTSSVHVCLSYCLEVRLDRRLPCLPVCHQLQNLHHKFSQTLPTHLLFQLNLVTESTLFIYLFIYWRLTAPSATQGHLRAFHKFKSRTSWIQNKTCTVYKSKTYKHNAKVSPFGTAPIKHGK